MEPPLHFFIVCYLVYGKFWTIKLKKGCQSVETLNQLHLILLGAVRVQWMFAWPVVSLDVDKSSEFLMHYCSLIYDKLTIYKYFEKEILTCHESGGSFFYGKRFEKIR